MIVLNEKEYAEKCLKDGLIENKPFFVLFILAKYYYHHLGFRKKKIIDLLTEFMNKNYNRYTCNKSDWDNSIEKIATNVGKYKLFELDGIWITKSELAVIEAIQNKVLERLAFTMLCLAKLSNAKNPNNAGWVNLDAKDIFSLARISCSVVGRYEKLSTLNQLQLLEFPKKNDNLSCRVTYINDDSEKILFISDFRELGYEYLKYKNENFIRCRECGVLIRNNKNGTKKYCSACSGYIPIETKIITCVDCGDEFEIKSKNNQSTRCPECYEIYRKDRKLETQRLRRTKAK